MRDGSVARTHVFTADEALPAWMVAHRALSKLARERALADAEEGRWLLAALRAGVHVQLGFGGFAEYVERLFGYKPRTTREKLRVAEALETLPALSEALRGGALSWCAVRELVRVALRETEQVWIDAARGKTLREIEELVAGKLPGDGPDTPYRPEARRHVLRFDVSAETYATFREAVAELRRRTPTSLDDDDATLLALARHVLGGPLDSGRASYQVALRVCPACGDGAQLGDGQLVPLASESIEMARCDAQEFFAPANDNLQTHVGRAKQTIPPATRRAVLERDQHRCRAPGCKNTLFLDCHHIVLRSEGGRNGAENLITLCGAHHRAVHRGQLVITSDAGVISFHHSDGCTYGSLPEPRAIDPSEPNAPDLHARVFAALRGLGFRESEVRNALSEVRAASAGATANAEALLREALLRLTPETRRR